MLFLVTWIALYQEFLMIMLNSQIEGNCTELAREALTWKLSSAAALSFLPEWKKACVIPCDASWEEMRDRWRQNWE